MFKTCSFFLDAITKVPIFLIMNEILGLVYLCIWHFLIGKTIEVAPLHNWILINLLYICVIYFALLFLIKRLGIYATLTFSLKHHWLQMYFVLLCFPSLFVCIFIVDSIFTFSLVFYHCASYFSHWLTPTYITNRYEKIIKEILFIERYYFFCTMSKGHILNVT